jgi:anti-sigma factor RsiW
MIRCSEAEKFVSLYIDNKLEASQESDFKEHIKTCGSCRKELEEMETLANVCRSMPEIPLPEGFKTQLHEKLRQT